MSTLAFESDDLGRTEEFFTHNYARMRIAGTTPAASRTSILRRVMPSVTIDEIDLGFDMSYTVDPMRSITLCLVHEGSIQKPTPEGVTDVYGPGDLVSLAPPDRSSSGQVHSARYTLTMLNPGLLAQVAATSEVSNPRPVRLTGRRPHSAAAALRLQNTICYLRDQVLPDPTLADQPLIISTAGQLLAANVLSAFPNTACTKPTPSDRGDARPSTLRRAVAYIDEHADRPITLAEIAAAAHVTIRALQYAFRQHLDTTPLAHLRQVRLARAHDDLMAADPVSDTTVLGIATRWGFFHMGRFAALYRETYGRTPSQALAGTVSAPWERPPGERDEGAGDLGLTA